MKEKTLLMTLICCRSSYPFLKKQNRILNIEYFLLQKFLLPMRLLPPAVIILPGILNTISESIRTSFGKTGTAFPYLTEMKMPKNSPDWQMMFFNILVWDAETSPSFMCLKDMI